MKKFISFALVLVLCLGLFVSCADTEPDNDRDDEPKGTSAPNTVPTTTPGETITVDDLKAAVDYLYNMYKPAVKGEPTKITTDKDLLASVMIGGISFNIEWTVNVTSGPAEGVAIGESLTPNMVKIDIMDDPEEDLLYTLTATVKHGDLEPQSVSFDYFTPAKVKVDVQDGKIVLFFPNENKYVTEEVYEYQSSSGSVKNELVLSDDKSAAVVMTIRENDDKSVTFITDSGKYLFCDGTNVHFATEEGEFTKFFLEAADGGQYIKSNGLYNNDPNKPQYLEVYKGYLTCYGLSDTSDVKIYTFQTEAVSGVSQSAILDAAYALGTGEALDGTFTLTGIISKIDTAWSDQYQNITVTIVCDGDAARPMMCYRLKGDGAKNLAVGDTITVTGAIKNYNGTVEFDAGCSLDKVVKGEGNDTPDTPDTPDVPATEPAYVKTPEIGKSYKLGLYQAQKGEVNYFTGVMKGYYGDTATDKSKGVDVKLEDAGSGKYYITFTVEGTKYYVGTEVSGTHLNFKIMDEANRATFTWDAAHGTFLTVMSDGTEAFMGTYGGYYTVGMSALDKLDSSYPVHLYE